MKWLVPFTPNMEQRGLQRKAKKKYTYLSKMFEILNIDAGDIYLSFETKTRLRR